MLRFLFVEIVLRVSTFVEIGFLVLGCKVQTLYLVYIACTGERLLLVVVECRERSGRNNRSDLAIEVRSISGVDSPLSSATEVLPPVATFTASRTSP